MFSIGDKVVYPMHGAGTIEAIEEKEMLGQTEDYYIIKMPIDDVKVMVPTNRAKNIGVRQISNKIEADKVYLILEQPMEQLSCDSNWNKRYSSNIDKIKSGSINEVTEVFKELSHRHMEKGLSLGEKKMLTTSKNILLSELVLSQNECHEVLDNKIEGIVKLSFDNWIESNL
ncbi:MAG: CarD family transcriptional regulator [Clostridia bacterium]|nr:CarD family transcriptional regulator [Clostridia bacterium]MDD4386888.1 CarD family transcriptional regulator [Clostridia bacterium]